MTSTWTDGIQMHTAQDQRQTPINAIWDKRVITYYSRRQCENEYLDRSQPCLLTYVNGTDVVTTWTEAYLTTTNSSHASDHRAASFFCFIWCRHIAMHRQLAHNHKVTAGPTSHLVQGLALGGSLETSLSTVGSCLPPDCIRDKGLWTRSSPSLPPSINSPIMK